MGRVVGIASPCWLMQLRNAVSRLLESGAPSLVVVDGDRELGLFTLDVAEGLL